MLFVLETILIGFVSGYLSGQFGIGGGLVTTPGLRLILNTSAGVALGTTLPVVVPSAFFGLISYSREGAVDWWLAKYLAGAGLFGVVIGAILTAFISTNLLLFMTALIIFVLALPYLFPEREHRLARWFTNESLVAIGLGLAAGFFSGLLGLGGGFILIPGMTGLLGRQIRTAFGTSLVALAVYAIPGSIIHYYLGHINPKIMILLIIGVIPGAYLGGRAAILIKESVLRFLFGLFLIVVALYFGFFEARIVF